MVSSRPAQSLSPNQFPLLQNVRTRFGVLEAKKSEASWTMTGLPTTPTIYGAWSGTISGVEYAILAVKNGGAVDIYDSLDGLAWTVRGQSSPSSGIYTSSSLSDSLCVKFGVSFQPVNDPWVGQGVLISDGGKILMYCPVNNYLRVRPVSDFNPTGGYAKDCSITGSLGRTLYDATYATTLAVSTTGAFGYVAPTTTAAAQINIGATQAVGSSLSITFTGAINSTNGRQFAMLMSTTDADCDIFRNCKVELFVGASNYVIHDPMGTDYNDCSLENFSDPNITYTTTPNTVPQKTLQLYVWNIQSDTFSGDVTKVIFTYRGATNRYKATPLELLSAGISGTGISGIPNYAVSYVDTDSGAESGSVVLNSERASGAMVTYLTATGTKYFPFPISYSLRMNWSINVTPNVPPTSYSALFLYRKDPGSSGYFYVRGSAVGVSAWSGVSGVPTPNVWVSIGFGPISDIKDETGLDPERPAPTAYNTVPTGAGGYPIGFTCAAFANNRLFVGSSGQYQFSEYRFPLRFSIGVRFDDSPLTAGGFKFANESPQAFAPLIGDINLDRIALFTDKGAYSIAGFDAFSLMRPSRISQFGTNSSKSVVARRETIFMLDDARHLRSIPDEGGLESRSYDVKDILDGIPSPTIPTTYGITKTWGAVFDDRYHLFYCKNGDTTNKYSFVVDLISGTLVQDSYSTGIVCTFQMGSKLIGVKSDGTASQLEAGASDVTISVTSREIVTDGDSWLMERQRIYAESNTGKSLTMSWTSFPTGAAPITSSVPLDPVASSVRIDVSTVLGKGISGRSIQAGFSGAIPGGKRIFEWEFETEDRVSRGTV